MNIVNQQESSIECERVEVKFLKIMAGVNKRDKIQKNQLINQKTDEKTEMASRVERNVLRWFDHSEKMNEACSTKKRGLNEISDVTALRWIKIFGWIDDVVSALNKKKDYENMCQKRK